MDAPFITVLNRDLTPAGYVRARIGMRTYSGRITRFTDKTIWTQNRDGSEAKHRFHDGSVPGTYPSWMRKTDVLVTAEERFGGGS